MLGLPGEVPLRRDRWAQDRRIRAGPLLEPRSRSHWAPPQHADHAGPQQNTGATRRPPRCWVPPRARAATAPAV